MLESGAGGAVDDRVVSILGDDAAMIRINEKLLALTTADFFTPIIDDPYIQGQIAACNSMNDVYAKGALDIISVLVLMGMPENMPSDIRAQMLRGFTDFCKSAHAPLVGGQTIICPWPILGGAITALAEPHDVIPISGAKPGDRIVLTKPLGIQPIMEALRLPEAGQDKLAEQIPGREISKSIDYAVELMTTSNRGAAEAMLETGVHAATDVTGFGILGHAANMAEQSKVSIEIHTLPIIKWTSKIAGTLKIPLLEGEGVETSGGLLISVTPERLHRLQEKLKEKGSKAFEIGRVTEGEGRAGICREPRVLEISR